MDNPEAVYDAVADGLDPPASLLNVKIRSRRSDSPVDLSDDADRQTTAERTDLPESETVEAVEPVEAEEVEVLAPPDDLADDADVIDVDIPPEPQRAPRAAPSPHPRYGVEDLIDLWADHLENKDYLPRDIPIDTVVSKWSDVFVLRASGWRGRRVELETKGHMSHGGVDAGPGGGLMAELMDMARRSVADERPYHESIVARTDAGETEIGLLTLPLAGDGKRPDRVLCHFYKV